MLRQLFDLPEDACLLPEPTDHTYSIQRCANYLKGLSQEKLVYWLLNALGYDNPGPLAACMEALFHTGNKTDDAEKIVIIYRESPDLQTKLRAAFLYILDKCPQNDFTETGFALSNPLTAKLLAIITRLELTGKDDSFAKAVINLALRTYPL